MEFTLVNEKSSLLEKVIQLGDQNRTTLGFLPRQAFEEHARKNHIIAITDGAELVAYLLYRTKNSVAIIVHLCVAQQHRETSCAKQLVEHLLEIIGESIAAVQLACRRDYGLDNFWHSIGFRPVSEKSGRATRQLTTLTIWARSNPNCRNLFTQFEKTNGKTSVLLDTNIVIDLFCGNNDESNALSSDYLMNDVQYYIPDNTLTEINRNPDSIRRIEILKFAQEHFEVAGVEQSYFETIRSELLQKHPAPKYSNTWFDISNIASAIAFGASYYITRDDEWLNTNISDDIRSCYGLSIMRPGEFIRCLDELESPNDYAPLKLYGLGIEWKKLSADDLSETVNSLHQNYGKKSAFYDFISQKMVDAHHDFYIVKVKGAIVSLSCIEYVDKKAVVSLLIIKDKVVPPSSFPTFVKWIAAKVFEKVQQEQKFQLEIPETALSPDTQEVFRNSTFFAAKDSFFRIVMPQIVSKDSFEQKYIYPNPYWTAHKQESGATKFRWTPRFEYQMERMLSPMKLTPSSLPTYIVPISGNYAKELFDEALTDENPNFLTNDHMMATLSNEKVYFKSPQQKITCFPARILWYVSNQRGLIGSRKIRACSILDDVTTGPTKEVFKKYQRLGILSWHELQSIVDGAEEITAYSFSCTELLSNPISLEDARQILGKPNETFPSYRIITESQFLELYRRGTNCETQ